MHDTHRPRKRFGQHFLTNGAIANKIVDAAQLHGDETALEIGPGKGALTSLLAARARRVVAVEIDRDLAAMLRSTYADAANIEIVEADILNADLDAVLGAESAPAVAVANLPYNVATPAIDVLIRSGRISRAVLMVQLEVADRLAAKTGEKAYSLLTVNLAPYVVTRRLFTVPPKAFSPKPKVMSCVVEMRIFERPMFGELDYAVYHRLAKAAFGKRRKMVRNTLVPALGEYGIEGKQATAALGAAGIEPEMRPDVISVEAYAQLTEYVMAHGSCGGSGHEA